MPALRKVEIAKIMDEEPRTCGTCPTILEEHEERFCRSCGPYWADVEAGLFDQYDWPNCGQERSSE